MTPLNLPFVAKKQILQVTLEKEGEKIWGRVRVGDNLIVDSAVTLQTLEKKLRKLLKNFEGLEDAEFEYS
jgi:hypothetical protein